MTTNKQNDASALRLGVMLGRPKANKKTGLCRPECPYKKEWRHPYWNHTAWCWHQMKDLGWYDYWLADCIDNEPDKQLAFHRESGRTKPPNAKLSRAHRMRDEEDE